MWEQPHKFGVFRKKKKTMNSIVDFQRISFDKNVNLIRCLYRFGLYTLSLNYSDKKKTKSHKDI